MPGLSLLTRIAGPRTATQPIHRSCKRPAHTRSRTLKTVAKGEHDLRSKQVTKNIDEAVLQRSRRDVLTMAACALAARTVSDESALAESPAPVVSRKVYFDITVDGVYKVWVLDCIIVCL